MLLDIILAKIRKFLAEIQKIMAKILFFLSFMFTFAMSLMDFICFVLQH